MSSGTWLGAGGPVRVAIVTNILPAYRKGFFDRLLAREDLRITVFCQDQIRGKGFRTIEGLYPSHVRLVEFVSAPAERVCWQFLPWSQLVRDFDVVFVDGNPRVVSHALLATLLKVLGRPLVLATMAHTYSAGRTSEAIRLWWTRWFSPLLVYTDREVAYLRERGFQRNVIVGMNNGLDQSFIEECSREWPASRLAVWRAAQELEGRTILLSSARLEAKNEFHLVPEALRQIIGERPDVVWCLVGDGAEEASLRALVSDHDLDHHVRFVGPQFDERALAPWFLAASVFVLPGAIGLSLLHAFGYGLPVVTHGEAALHGPEFAAFEPGRTGQTFERGDAVSLAQRVVEVLSDGDRLAAMGAEARRRAREEYNVDVMVERFDAVMRMAAAGAAAQGRKKRASIPFGE